MTNFLLFLAGRKGARMANCGVASAERAHGRNREEQRGAKERAATRRTRVSHKTHTDTPAHTHPALCGGGGFSRFRVHPHAYGHSHCHRALFPRL